MTHIVAMPFSLPSRRRTRIAILSILLLGALSVGAWFFYTWQRAPIYIGIIAPLSGPAQSLGVSIADVATIVENDINSHGGIQGRPVIFAIADSKSSPEGGREAFFELERSVKPLVYLVGLSSVSDAVSDLAAHYGVVVLSVATSDERAGSEWVWHYPTVSESIVPPLESIFEGIEASSLGVVYLDDVFGYSQRRLAEGVFLETSQEGVIEEVAVALQATSLEPTVEQVFDTDALYLALYPSHVMRLLPVLEEQGYQGSIIIPHSGAVPEVFTLPEAEGAFVVTTPIYNENFLFARDARTLFAAAGDISFNFANTVSYDLMNIAIAAIERSGLHRPAVKSLFDGGFSYSGIFGTINLPAGEHRIALPLYRGRVVDSALRYDEF